MLTIPNLISLLRLPLAFLFLFPDPSIRMVAVVVAMISDCLDGFIARRYGQVSRWGTVIDPLADKFFAVIVLSILIHENTLTFSEASAMLSRDIALCFFGAYLLSSGQLGKYQFRAIFMGKITTALQFACFIALTLQISLPSYLYYGFVLLGLASFLELYLSKNNASNALKL